MAFMPGTMEMTLPFSPVEAGVPQPARAATKGKKGGDMVGGDGFEPPTLSV